MLIFVRKLKKILKTNKGGNLMENQNGLMLIEHIDDFKRNARQYFESKKWLSKLEIDKKISCGNKF